jgi:hypothetical protein
MSKKKSMKQPKGMHPSFNGNTSSNNGTLELTFTLEKETPGTFRFKEDGDEDQHKVGALYIKKAAFGKKGAPKEISVTITL